MNRLVCSAVEISVSSLILPFSLFLLPQQGEFREDNFNTAMQVLRDAGDPGSSGGGGKWDPKGRRGGTKGEVSSI